MGKRFESVMLALDRKRLALIDSSLADLRNMHRHVTGLARAQMKETGEIRDTTLKLLALVEKRGRALRKSRAEFEAHAVYLEILTADNSTAPPRFGERILLLILTKEERVNIPGDLEEEYRSIAAKHGARYAKLWYYKQVAASAWPMVRKAARWGLLASVGEWIRRII
jgi:hypothetical protein